MRIPVGTSRVVPCTWAGLAILIVLATASCAFHRHRPNADPTRDVAHALLSNLIEGTRPQDRIVCVDIFIGPAGTRKLDSGPTLEYLKARGKAAFDGSECATIPPPSDASGDWSHYGEMVHVNTGRAAASYGIRVIQVNGGNATLRGWYSFSRRHGASCPYEARLEGGRWVVRLPANAVCAVA